MHMLAGQQEPEQSVHQVACAQRPAAPLLQNPARTAKQQRARLRCASERAGTADASRRDDTLHTAPAGTSHVPVMHDWPHASKLE